MKIRLLFLVVCLFVFSSYSQGVNEQEEQNSITNQFSKIVSVPNSPEAEAFEKYGNLEVNLHTGTPNVSVPLTTIKGRELDLPLSLTYDASGIKVDQVATNVGLGWNLNAGGRVSLQARGLSDYYHDITGIGYSSPRDSDIRAKIQLYSDYLGPGTTSDVIFDDSDMNVVRANVKEYYDLLYDVSIGAADIEQDYYTINILGVNETIWIDPSTYEPVIIGNNNIQIDWQISLNPPKDIIGWKIIDEQGNQYLFGEYVDYDNIDQPPTNFVAGNNIEKTKRIDYKGDMGDNPVFNLISTYNNSWLIKKIISKNGKDVYHFSYTDNPEFIAGELSSRISSMVTHGRVCYPNGTVEYEGKNILPNSIKTSSIDSRNTQQFISSIFHNGKEVLKFDFEDRDDIQNGIDKAIKSISTYEDYNNDPTTLKKVELNYSYFGESDPINDGIYNFYNLRLKLDKVIFNVGQDESFYQFDYFSPLLIPSRRSFSRDYLGYFNNKPNPSPFETYESNNGLSDYQLPGGNRDVSSGYTKVGTLSKIYYPTGGYSEFKYENHSDGIEYYPGLRIKSISDYSNNANLASTKEYEYGTIYKPFTAILDLEITQQRDPGSTASGQCYIPRLLYRYTMPPNISSGSYVSYNEVTEKRMVNDLQEGYTVFTFNNDKKGWEPKWNSVHPFEKEFYSSFKHGKVSSKLVKDENDIGLVLEETFYTEENSEENDGIFNTDTYLSDESIMLHNNLDLRRTYIMMSRESSGELVISKPTIEYAGNGGYTYDDDCSNSNLNVKCLADTKYGALETKIIKINGYSGGVTQVVKTEYNSNGNIITTTDNTYTPDSYFLKTSTTTINNGESIKKKYTYLEEIGSLSSAQQEMEERNIISDPIITESFKVYSNNTEQLLSTQEVVHELWGADDYILPKYVKTAKGDITANNPLETRIVYQDYDSYGNPVDILLSGGAHTSYIWTYEGKHVAAKLENTTYGSISSSDKTAINNATDESSLITALGTLRSNMPNTQITTFTYIPMVGVSTITDPTGNTLSYHYDGNHRLKYVKDKDGKVVSENTYNYGDGSELILTGGSITVLPQGNDNDGRGEYVEFQVNTSNIHPNGSGPYNFLWTSSNGMVYSTNQEDEQPTVKVYFTCSGLSGDSLFVNCRVQDEAEDYYHVDIAHGVTPNLCSIEGEITYTVNSGSVVFEISPTGGTLPYSYKWNRTSNPLDGFNGANNHNGSTYTVTYDCSAINAIMSVMCEVEDADGSTEVFTQSVVGGDPLCDIYIDGGIQVSIIDTSNDIIKLSVNVKDESGNTITDYTTIWSAVNVTNGDMISGELNGQDYPYWDENGNYYLRYDCWNQSGDIKLSADVFVVHGNGGSDNASLPSNYYVDQSCNIN